MSEERFDRIEQRLDRVEAGVVKLDTRLDDLTGDVSRLDSRLDELSGHVSSLDSRIDDLGRHMRVLHEDTIARIAATREYTGPTREEFAELKDMIGRRLDPLETVVGQHSIDIERLKRRRR